MRPIISERGTKTGPRLIIHLITNFRFHNSTKARISRAEDPFSPGDFRTGTAAKRRTPALAMQIYVKYD